MPFPYDKYPWLNFQELNLAYFIKHFREIFQEWNTLFHDLTEWKDATDTELEEWKTTTLAGLDTWRALTIEHFETSISGWETDTLAALDAWKAAFEAEYAALKLEVEGIRDQAAADAAAAAQSARDAQTAQAAAEAAALSIQSSAALIAEHTQEISELDDGVQLLAGELFGTVDNTFPLRFTAGTYRNTAAGNTLEIYHTTAYDATRKVVATTVFNSPCDVEINALTGYQFSIYPSTGGVISEAINNLTSYTLRAGQQYGIRLRASDDSDISSLTAEDMITIVYTSRVDQLEDELDARVTPLEALTEILPTNLIDQDRLLRNPGITKVDDYFILTPKQLNASFNQLVGGFPIDATFKPATQYKIAFEAYNTAATNTGNAWIVAFRYTIGDPTQYTASANIHDWTAFSLESDPTRDVTMVTFSYYAHGDDVWRFRNMVLVEGASAYYTPYQITDIDAEARPLEASGDSTDRSSDILARLAVYGSCELGAGDYYINPLKMPDGTCIRGIREKTRLLLMPDAEGAAIELGSRCTLRDLRISGSLTTLTPDGNAEFTPTYDSANPGLQRSGILHRISTNNPSLITGCIVENFTCAGILAYDTGTNVDKGLLISDCWVQYCNVGIFFRKNTEFNKVSGCEISHCYYGYYNRGGNNIIIGSGIDANHVNVRIDNSEGSNWGHGIIDGCSLNHAGNDVGDMIYMNGAGVMAITGCQFYYGVLHLVNTRGSVFSGCHFGADAVITISNGADRCNVFSGCCFNSSDDNPITGAGTITKFDACYYRDGSTVVPQS